MTVSGGRAGGWTANSSGVRNSPAAATDRPLVLPHLGEKFELTGRHAEGATCEVFKAHHVALDIAVAVKILRPEYAGDPRYLERMRIEAQVLPRLRSRHIVQCFDRGLTEDGRPYTVLEFLRGETLESLFERVGRFDEATTVELGTALFEALSVAHARGIVHRDVTLRNLIVHRTEHEPATLKLIDFGFAWIMPSAPESAPEPAEMSERDLVVGTPRFTSPEVALGHASIDERADLYSAGIVLYSLLAGRDPFAELKSPESVLQAHAHRSVPPLSLHARGVSKELEEVVMRLLAKNRADRFASANEAMRDLVEAGKVARHRAHLRHTVPPATTTVRLALEGGERCGPYVVTKPIDSAGTAEVYEAETFGTPQKRKVALKITKHGFTLDAVARAKFLEAARLLTTIRHPNVPIVHQFGEHDGAPWFSMDLVPGGTSLRRHLNQRGALSPAQAIKLAYGIAGAARLLHRLGIIHGHLNPECVIVTPAGEASVIPPLPTDSLPATAVRSDIRAWALILFEMLTGRTHARPMSPSAPTSLETLLDRLDDQIPSHDEVAPHLPKRLWQLLESATGTRSTIRLENFSDVCTALDEACDGIPLAHPLVATHEYAIAVNGNVLVLLRRAPGDDDVHNIIEAIQRDGSHVRAALVVVVDDCANTGAPPARSELELLATWLTSRFDGVALVHPGRSHTTPVPSTRPNGAPIGHFTSVHTAVEWLERYHSRLAGLSDLTAVVTDLRRQARDASSALHFARPHVSAPPRAASPEVGGAETRALTTRRVDSLLILRQNRDDPSDEEWNECLELLESAIDSHGHVKVLVVTEGGGPTRSQRERLHNITRTGDVWVAVVSESMRAPFVVSAVALLHTRIRSFEPTKLQAAFEHLGLNAAERSTAAANLATMTTMIQRSPAHRVS